MRGGAPLMMAFDDHTSTAWIPPLQAYAATLTTAHRNLPDAGLPAALTRMFAGRPVPGRHRVVRRRDPVRRP
ncbi:hypothetical protein ACWDBC_35215 [Streptomyces parvus]